MTRPVQLRFDNAESASAFVRTLEDQSRELASGSLLRRRMPAVAPMDRPFGGLRYIAVKCDHGKVHFFRVVVFREGGAIMLRCTLMEGPDPLSVSILASALGLLTFVLVPGLLSLLYAAFVKLGPVGLLFAPIIMLAIAGLIRGSLGHYRLAKITEAEHCSHPHGCVQLIERFLALRPQCERVAQAVPPPGP